MPSNTTKYDVSCTGCSDARKDTPLVLPSKYFGTNAAWLRLAVIAYNVLTALKRLALPADLLRARPKRLRFLIFYTVGRLVHHARQMRLRLAREAEGIVLWLEALRFLPLQS
jgi:hypothetical protein